MIKWRDFVNYDKFFGERGSTVKEKIDSNSFFFFTSTAKKGQDKDYVFLKEPLHSVRDLYNLYV